MAQVLLRPMNLLGRHVFGAMVHEDPNLRIRVFRGNILDTTLEHLLRDLGSNSKVILEILSTPVGGKSNILHSYEMTFIEGYVKSHQTIRLIHAGGFLLQNPPEDIWQLTFKY